MVRVAIQGDIGQQVYHVGDEAMVHAAVEQLKRRGICSVVLLTRDPAQTRVHFGAELDAAPTLVFPWPPVDRERYLGEIKAVLAGDTGVLPPHDQVFGVIETLRQVDALFIAGGGNMNSRYGWLLYERAAMAHIAARLGKRVVIGGQTLGPELSETDRDTLAELLRLGSLVGLREDHSLRLARDLVPGHAGLRSVLDDASDLPDPEPPIEPRTDRTIAATFSPPDEDVPSPAAAEAYARLLDAVAVSMDATVRFLPHMSTVGKGDGDEAFHAQIAERLGARAELAPIRSALSTAALTRQAAAVVTSRYHPVVFACAAGIPAVAVAPDEYTRVRLSGALQRFGRRQAVPSLTDLLSSDSVVPSWLAPLAQPPTAPAPAILAAQSKWWDDVVTALATARGRRRWRGWPWRGR
jgi:polysaccharide pyruvyl transferase WcaK-like protein